MLFNTSISGMLASCRITLVAAILMAGSAYAKGESEIMTNEPKSLPPLPYLDETGQKQTVKTEGYRLTALHFWATWCVPCVDELPIVNAVARHYGSKGLQVIALSEDGDANMHKVKQFYSDYGIQAIKPYIDSDMAAFQAATVRGLPTTLFLDKDGNEIARAEGVLDWDSPSVRDFIDSQLKAEAR